VSLPYDFLPPGLSPWLPGMKPPPFAPPVCPYEVLYWLL
jgi:hypothetical protein